MQAEPRSTAADWARGYGITRSAFLASVTAVETFPIACERLRVRGRRRQVGVERRPSAQPRGVPGPSPDPSRIDPWRRDPELLPAESRCTVLCPGCRATGEVVCPECKGSLEKRCPDCYGSGRIVSEKTGRRILCRSCRGRRGRRCSCRSGTARCPDCLGQRTVEEFLVIRERAFAFVATSRANALSDTLGRFGASESFDIRSRPEWQDPVLRWTGTDFSIAPPAVKEIIRRLDDQIQGVDPRSDRVDAVDVQRFEATVSVVRYSCFGRTGHVRVRNWNGKVEAGLHSDRPLLLWRRNMTAAGGLGLVLGLLMAGLYASMHTFLAHSSGAVALWLLAPILGLALLPLAASFGLPETDRRASRIALALLPLLAVILAQGLAAKEGYPSLTEARYWLGAGNTDRALAELEACVDLAVRAVDAAKLHDAVLVDVSLHEVRAPNVWRTIRVRFFSEASRETVVEHALAITLAEAERRQKAGAWEASADLLELIPEELAGDDRARSLRRDLTRQRLLGCAQDHDLGCATRALRLAVQREALGSEEREALGEEVDTLLLPRIVDRWRLVRGRGGDLDWKLSACEDLQGAVDFVEGLGDEVSRLPVTGAKLAGTCASLRAELQEQAQAALWAQQQQQQRSQKDLRARWASAPLLCRDGTLSPSCTCGRNPKSGCCSHHRGVAGCSVPYPG